MKREIKFRAWDKTYKRMNYKVQVGNTDYADQNYTCNSIWVDYGDSKSIGWMNADGNGIELMQFTGLKDMNGTEIYEGDIVSFEDDPNGVVKWNSDFSCWTYWESDHLNTEEEVFEWSQLIKRDCKHYIVRGNIYENPELLQ